MSGKQKQRVILAKGETTGHAHAAEGAGVELMEEGKTKVLKALESGAVVTHEEHGTVNLPRGEFEIGIVQEYDHFGEEARHVRD